MKVLFSLVGLFCIGALLPAGHQPGKAASAIHQAPAYFLAADETQTSQQHNPALKAELLTTAGPVRFTNDGAYIGIPLAQTKGSALVEDAPYTAVQKNTTAVMRLGFHGTTGKAGVQPRLVENMGSRIRLMRGDKASWRTNNTAWRKLVYDQVWPGITVEYHGFMDRLECRLIIEPGADPGAVIMETGAQTLHVLHHGGLTASLGEGRMSLSSPRVVEGDGSVTYAPRENGRYGIQVAGRAVDQEMTLSMELTWSTFIGTEASSTQEEIITDVTVDAQDNIYLAGLNFVNGFPTTPGVYNHPGGDYDCYIAKFSSDLSRLLFATFIGGNATDSPADLIIDGEGNIHLLVNTKSVDFPTTDGALSQTLNGENDIALLKLTGDGAKLLHGTYLGGTSDDYGTVLRLDEAGNILVGGQSYSEDYPITPGAYDIHLTGRSDIVVSKLDPSASTLLASTYLGGNQRDFSPELAILPSGDLIVGGSTDTNFIIPPVSANSGTETGVPIYYTDILIARLTGDLANLVYWKTHGGLNTERLDNLDMDDSGRLVLFGTTWSPDFPVTDDAYDGVIGGHSDYFLMKAAAADGELVYSSFLGGSSGEMIGDLHLFEDGSLMIIGSTLSTDYPVTPGALQSVHAGSWDMVITGLNAAGDALTWSTFLGGEDLEYGYNLGVTGDGRVIVGGMTKSEDFPTTPNGLQTTYSGGSSDGCVAVLNPSLSKLEYSTYLGGGGWDSVADTAVDEAGNIIVVGRTTSTTFPTTPGVFDDRLGAAMDGFVAKLDPTGSELIFASYLGGSRVDLVTAVAVDSLGRIVVGGETTSDDFPVTPGAWRRVRSAGYDQFVAKFTYDGDALEFATFIGGEMDDDVNGIILDDTDHIYVAGAVLSGDYPTTPGAYKTSKSDGGLFSWEGALVKLVPDGSDAVFSTFLGGNGGQEWITDVALDSKMCPVVAGTTETSAFPVTPGAYNNGAGVFVTNFSPDGRELLYSALIGGGETVFRTELALTSTDEAVVAGTTEEARFPTTAHAHDTTFEGWRDGFLARLSADGSQLLYGTYLGGEGVEYVAALLVDDEDRAIVFGQTDSAYFPTTENADDATYNGEYDTFLSVFSRDGSLSYGTYLGGSLNDLAVAMAAHPEGGMVLVGSTYSIEYPATAGTYRDYRSGQWDTFITRFNFCLEPDLRVAGAALGLTDPEYWIDVTCEDGESILNWSTDPPTPMVQDGNRMILSPPPNETTTITVTVDSPAYGDFSFESVLLVTDNTQYRDYNNDNCNNIQDLWDFALWWDRNYSDDPNGDGRVDIRDLLYLNTPATDTCD